MMECSGFSRFVIAKCSNGHFYPINDRFNQCNQGPYRCGTDTAGTNKADFGSPDGMGKFRSGLAGFRSHYTGQVWNKHTPGKKSTYENGDAAGNIDEVTGTKQLHGKSHRELSGGSPAKGNPVAHFRRGYMEAIGKKGKESGYECTAYNILHTTGLSGFTLSLSLVLAHLAAYFENFCSCTAFRIREVAVYDHGTAEWNGK